MLLPPETSRIVAKGKEVIKKGEDDEAIMYMNDIFPRIKNQYGPSIIKDMWFIQYPGDIVFVPGGWWHVVVNLDDTIAITQNFCSSVNFEYVWTKLRSERKKLSVKFLETLKYKFPELYELALNLNNRDSFTMFNPQLLKKKRNFEDNNKNTNDNSDSSSDSSSSSDSNN